MVERAPARPPENASSRRLDRTDWWFLLVCALVAELLVYLDLHDTFFWFNDRGDSAFWYEQSQEPILSRAFWATVPVYPVVLRTLGTETALHVFQVVFSAIAWCWLAFQVMRLVRNRWWGYGLFVFVILSSRNGAVQLSNHVVFTEGIATSIGVLLLAQALSLLRAPSRRGWVAFGVLGVLFIGSRPSNFTVVLLGVVLLGFAAWRLPEQRRVLVRIGAGGIACFALLVALNAGSDSESNNLYNIIPEWVLPDAEARAYFEDAGMPVPPELLALTGEELDTDQEEVVAGPLRPWKEWVDADGGSTYVRFLVTHPAWVLDKYLAAQDTLYSSTLPEENVTLETGAPFTGREMSPARTFGNPFYPDSFLVLLLWLVGATGGCIWSRRAGWTMPAWVWLGIALVVTAPVLAVPIIFGDSQQLARHGILLAVQLRAGLVLVTAWLVDEALSGHAAPTEGV